MTTRILRGTLVALVLGLAVWLAGHEFLRHGCFPLRIQPHYAGKPLEYWCQHSFDWRGSQKTSNADAVEALQSMKQDAIPFLVKWIGTMNHGGQRPDYEQLALQAFEVLGTNASPAIPGLIKIIGRNNNWPSSALGYIGPAAVPALIEHLKIHQAPDFFGNWRLGQEDDLSRAQTIGALSCFGTNAETALPLFLVIYEDEDKRSRAGMASALASVGHNHPEKIIPLLMAMLTNSVVTPRYDAAAALASFGSAAKPAIPELLAQCQMADARGKAQIGMDIKKIDPEWPNALQPLANNLTSEEAGLRESALFDIEQLGTNGLEILGSMRKMATQEPNPDWRTRILDWLTHYETNKEELAAIAHVNLTNEDESVICAAVRCLGGLAGNSQAGFAELLSVNNTIKNKQAEGNAHTCLYLAMEKHPEFLMNCLNSSESDVSFASMRFIHSLSRDSLVDIIYSSGTTTNEHWYVMKKIRGGRKTLLQDAVPILVKRLQDEHLETRQLATNILLELNPKAAKQAGVRVEMPYLYYAN